jgi:CheY-like chemotaxis protein
VSGSFDGVDLVSRLRQAEARKRTPIVVLSACSFDPDRQRVYAAGCDVFLSKPCLPEQLISAISDVGAA